MPPPEEGGRGVGNVQIPQKIIQKATVKAVAFIKLGFFYFFLKQILDNGNFSCYDEISFIGEFCPHGGSLSFHDKLKKF